MSQAIDIVVRRATPEDARPLAELMNMAGEGLPAYLWSQHCGPDESALDFGTRRVAGTEGGFSHVNARVAEVGRRVAGMLLGYRLPEPDDPGDLDQCPPVVRPLLELEALAPGSWYVNAVATDPACRGQGVGTRLMAEAEALARDSGAATLSLIVAEGNAGAVRLYERLGYTRLAHRPVEPYPGCSHKGRYVLMTRAV